MGWFGGKKKKASKKPPVLEPVGAPAAQVAPVAQPAIQPGQVPAAIPAVQAAPAAQPVAPAIQPVVEVAPVGVVADDNVVATTDYGISFSSIINFENLYGVQFHPEKSQNDGKQILSNFSKI